MKHATRFAVFRALVNFMERYEYCPGPTELARHTGLHATTVRKHMLALDGADGLPLPVTVSRTYETGRGYTHESARLDPYRAPIDRLVS